MDLNQTYDRALVRLLVVLLRLEEATDAAERRRWLLVRDNLAVAVRCAQDARRTARQAAPILLHIAESLIREADEVAVRLTARRQNSNA